MQRTRLSEDHPRLCGEKPDDDTVYKIVSGSPPPMRGKVCTDGVAADRDRITPAYAGKSAGAMIQRAKCRDHPRLCGEKSFSSDSNSLI